MISYREKIENIFYFYTPGGIARIIGVGYEGNSFKASGRSHPGGREAQAMYR